MPPGYPSGGVTVYRDLTSAYFHTMQWGGRGPRVQDYFYERAERLPQYCTEAVLRTRVETLPSVTTVFGWNVDSVVQEYNRATVTITPVDSYTPDAHRQFQADYVVGCDGGRSLVRETMGVDRGGRDFDQRMVLAVFRSRELHRFLERFPAATTYRVMKPELDGYWQFFGRVDVGESFFFHAPVPADTRTDTYDFLHLLYEAAGFTFDAELDYVGFWDLRIMVASQYHSGRLFIAGDACHQHPPYGGFGLNTGLEDAVNLGWKLAASVQGWGGDALLESYAAERRPIFVETGEAMIAGGIEVDRRFLQRYSPEKDASEFERAWNEWGRSGGFAAQTYEPHYAGSPIVEGELGAPCSIHGELSFKAEAGHHLAPRQLSTLAYGLKRGKTFFGTSSKIFFLSCSVNEPMPSITGLRSSSILPEPGSRYEPVPGFSVPNMHRSLPTIRTSNSMASGLYSTVSK
jgi:2-polyprenyl-6-methoxyphenol hydroxylase-like FAD-dependent oxidoreductase